MNYIHICDNAGKVIVSRLGPDCRDVCLGLTLAQCERCESHSGSGKRRRGKITVPAGSVFLCADDDDMVKSKRVFMKSLDLYAEMVSGLIEIQKLTLDEVRNENRRLVHNLTTLNSHIIQEIYNIVPQDDLAGGPSRQISVIADALSAKPVPAAQAALRILKNAVAARTEMQIVRRFQSAPQLPPQQRPHSNPNPIPLRLYFLA